MSGEEYAVKVRAVPFQKSHENHEGTFWWVREFGDLFWAQFWAGLFYQKYMTNKHMEYEYKSKAGACPGFLSMKFA